MNIQKELQDYKMRKQKDQDFIPRIHIPLEDFKKAQLAIALTEAWIQTLMDYFEFK